MAWLPKTQGDLIEILYYPQIQASYDSFQLAMDRVSALVPASVADGAITRIESLIIHFREAEASICSSVVKAPAPGGDDCCNDGRSMIQADDVKWSDNEKLFLAKQRLMMRCLEDARNRIRLAIGMSIGSNAPGGCCSSGKRMVRSC